MPSTLASAHRMKLRGLVQGGEGNGEWKVLEKMEKQLAEWLFDAFAFLALSYFLTFFWGQPGKKTSEEKDQKQAPRPGADGFTERSSGWLCLRAGGTGGWSGHAGSAWRGWRRLVRCIKNQGRFGCLFFVSRSTVVKLWLTWLT